jgi:hypothetical protein
VVGGCIHGECSLSHDERSLSHDEHLVYLSTCEQHRSNQGSLVNSYIYIQRAYPHRIALGSQNIRFLSDRNTFRTKRNSRVHSLSSNRRHYLIHVFQVNCRTMVKAEPGSDESSTRSNQF